MEILDIHTHRSAPYPQGVVSTGLRELKEGFSPIPGQDYSIGIHPWETGEDVTEEDWKMLEEIVRRPEVVAIGECGVDAGPKAGPMFRQLLIFKRLVGISEQVGKPMILHDVKADDIIVGLRRDLKPKCRWAIHGFRRKPEVAQMLLRAGLWLSFGAAYNPDALRSVPANRILAETDESVESIETIIERIGEDFGSHIDIAANTTEFLSLSETD